MIEGNIFNIQRYSLHDGGGIRSIVFFKGCPFSCPWCCNPESLCVEPQILYKQSLCMDCSKKEKGVCQTSVEQCPTGAKERVGYRCGVDEVFDVLARDYAFYETSQGGVTLSGGEVLMQPTFALALLQKCKDNNIHTAMETTLGLPLDNVQAWVDVCDLFLVDCKIWDTQESMDVLHLDCTIVQSNIKAIQALQGRVIARIPLIPEYTATPQNLDAITRYLKDINIVDVHLLPFHQWGEGKYKSLQKEYTCTHLKPLTDAAVEDIKARFVSQGFNTLIHG